MQLEPFVLTAEFASFSAAARALGVTPAAVSKSVARLEDSLGVRLLERTSRTVSLTPEGRLFLSHARSALDALQEGRDALAIRRETVAGPVRISVSPVLGHAVMTALARVTEEHEHLELRCHFTDEFVSLVDEADIAVRVGPLGDSTLVARPVHTTAFVILASPSFLERNGPIERPEDLLRTRCVFYYGPGGRPVRWTLPGTLSERMEVRVQVNNGNALIAAAEAGMGAIQVWEGLAPGALASGRLVKVLPDWTPPGPPIHLLYSTTKRSLPRIQVVLAALEHLFPDA